MGFPLSSARLILRPFQSSDLEAFLTYRNDPVVAEYQGWDVPYVRASAQEFIGDMAAAVPGTPGVWYQAAIQVRAGGQLAGDVAFHLMRSDPRQAYLGYTLARPFWGQGIASEAVGCLLGYLFGELELHRVVAECDELNAASIRLLERVGFRREGHLLENVWFKGRWSSEYHYAMLRREWKGG